MVAGDIFWVGSDTWNALASMATLGLVVLTAWYAKETRKTANAAEDAAKESAESSKTAVKAADAAAATAEATQRQADSLERDEIRRTMPVIHARAEGVARAGPGGPPQLLRVAVTNLGQGSALNISLNVAVGHMMGEPTPLQVALSPGDETRIGKLEIPVDDPEYPVKIEARYQDSVGRRYATQTDKGGNVNAYRVEEDGRFTPLLEPGQPTR